MKFLSILLVCIVFFVQLCLSQWQGRTNMRNRNYMDVPVQAGYRIASDDGEGYLEDGIVVKTKGTGYIDKKYRGLYGPGGQIVYGRPVTRN